MHKVRGLNMAFSSNLKYLMDYFDVSNYKLAQYIKSSQTSVKNWVTGERLPHPKTQKLIAELFGVTVEELNADEFPHIKGEHKLPLQKKARPSPEGDSLTQEFARIFDQLSPQGKNKIMAEILRIHRQEM
nr:MAG TPA: helix-turn-helix domain protein [Caudoviricetes sp.]